MEGEKVLIEEMLKEMAKSAMKHEEPEMNLEDHLKLFFGEYMAGGFDEKHLKPEVIAIFTAVEGLYDDEEDPSIPADLLEHWGNVGSSIYF